MLNDAEYNILNQQMNTLELTNQFNDPVLAELQTSEYLNNRIPGQTHRVRKDQFKGWSNEQISNYYSELEIQNKENSRRRQEQMEKDLEYQRRQIEILKEKERLFQLEEERKKDAKRELGHQLRADAVFSKNVNIARNRELGKNEIHESFFDAFGKDCR